MNSVMIEFSNLDFTEADYSKVNEVTRNDVSELNRLSEIFGIKKITLQNTIKLV